MAVEIYVQESFPHTGSLADLKEFVRQAEEHCLMSFTWTAYQGDQRDPSSLTLTALAVG